MSVLYEVRRGERTGRVFTTVREVMSAVEELHVARGCDGMATGAHTCLEVAPDEQPWAVIAVEPPRLAPAAPWVDPGVAPWWQTREEPTGEDAPEGADDDEPGIAPAAVAS